MAQFEAITGDVPPSTWMPNMPKSAAIPAAWYTACWVPAFSPPWRAFTCRASLLHGVECKFAKPVFIGDTLTITGTVVNVSEAVAEAEIKAVITNQDGKRVTRGIIKAGLAK